MDKADKLSSSTLLKGAGTVLAPLANGRATFFFARPGALLGGMQRQGGDARSDVDAFFGLKGDRLQRDGAVQSTAEHLGADAHAESGVSGDTGIGSR
ncbi:hypothetical protein D3C71_1522780 [compost metagenome]